MTSSEARQHVVVDSKWRRDTKFPNNWSYVVSFPETFRNVTSVDLVQAFIPSTQQTIHAFNSKFQCTPQGQPTVTITIPQGNYEPPLLLTAIQEQLTGNGINNPNFQLAPETNVVTFTCDTPFSLPFASGDQAGTSIHPYLGFSNIDVDNVTSASGFYAMSLPPPTFVTVDIAEVPSAGKRKNYSLQREVPSVYTTRPELMEVPFIGLVPLNTDFQTIQFWKAGDCDLIHRVFPPIDMRQFSITIRDDKGNLYDANSYNHVLVFQITQLSTPELPLMCNANNRAPGPSPWGVNCRFPYC